MATGGKQTVMREPFPAQTFTDESAARALNESRALTEMQKLPGWQLVHGAWKAVEARAGLDMLKESTPEKFEAARARRLGSRTPLEIIEERVALGERARAYVVKREQQEARQGEPAENEREFDPTEAQQAIAQGNMVRELVGHQGWDVLLHHLAARAWSHASLLQECGNGEAARHQAAIHWLKGPLYKLQSILGLADMAEAWFGRRTRRQQPEKGG